MHVINTCTISSILSTYLFDDNGIQNISFSYKKIPRAAEPASLARATDAGPEKQGFGKRQELIHIVQLLVRFNLITLAIIIFLYIT